MIASATTQNIAILYPFCRSVYTLLVSLLKENLEGRHLAKMSRKQFIADICEEDIELGIRRGKIHE